MKKISLTLALFLIVQIPAHAAQQFCVAHRGNSSEELENSRSAIMSAARLGVQAVEFDVQHTLEGIAIINHDDTLERTTQTSEECSEEIRKRKINRLFYHQVAKCRLTNGEEIPLLKDILSELQPYPIKLFVEFKSSPRMNDFLLFKKFYGKDPERLLIISFKDSFLDFALFMRKALPFLKEVKVLKLKGVAKKCDSRFDGLDAMFVGKRHVKAIQSRGKLIGTYTKNSRKKIRKYLERGLDFITTNFPQRCMEELESFL